MNNKKKTIRKLAVVSGFGIGMITVAGSAIYACEEETDPVLVSDASVEIASEKMAGDPGDKVPDQSEKERRLKLFRLWKTKVLNHRTSRRILNKKRKISGLMNPFYGKCLKITIQKTQRST